jgi:hypothetical protein
LRPAAVHRRELADLGAVELAQRLVIQGFELPQLPLPFLNTYRTMCLAPTPAFRKVLEGSREIPIAA